MPREEKIVKTVSCFAYRTGNYVILQNFLSDALQTIENKRFFQTLRVPSDARYYSPRHREYFQAAWKRQVKCAHPKRGLFFKKKLRESFVTTAIATMVALLAFSFEAIQSSAASTEKQKQVPLLPRLPNQKVRGKM